MIVIVILIVMMISSFRFFLYKYTIDCIMIIVIIIIIRKIRKASCPWHISNFFTMIIIIAQVLSLLSLSLSSLSLSSLIVVVVVVVVPNYSVYRHFPFGLPLLQHSYLSLHYCRHYCCSLSQSWTRCGGEHSQPVCDSENISNNNSNMISFKVSHSFFVNVYNSKHEQIVITTGIKVGLAV